MADPTKPVLSLDEIAKNSSTDFNQFTNAGKTFSFEAEGADRYLTYGSKVYGQLGYNPFGNNEKKYQQATSWTKDISRGFTGMTKLAGVGMSDTFGFGAFGSSENHKDFGKIMQDYGSQRGGVSGFFANTMLSAGYTVGIISSIAAEELLLAGATALSGGLLSGATVPAMGAEVARGASLLGKANKTLKGVDNTVGVFGWMKNIDNARWYKEAKDAGAVGMGAVGSLSRGVGGFGKALMPLGNTLDFIRSADKIKDFNGLQKTLLGAGSIARDARKFYMSHSESDLEAKFVRDELTTDAIAKWNRANPGQSMPESVKNFIDIKAQKAYDRAYETNFGLIYLTNAITFEGLLKGFSPTNKLFGMVDNFSVAGKGSRSIAFNAVTPTVKNYIKKKASELTLGNVIGGTVRASMEGVQEYGQDIISSAAKKYGDIKFEIKGYEKDVFGKPVLNGEGKKIPIYGKMITDPTSDMSRGAYWSQVANSMGDSNIETFMSGALMGIFASPVNFATKVVSEYSFGERGFGSEYNAWTKEGKKNYKNLLEERQKTAEFLTEISKKQGIALEVDITSPVHRMTGLREKMLEAARNGDQKFFEDNKAEIFRLGMRSMFKTGMHGELVDHLDQMLKHSAKELNESLDRIDITEENKQEYYDKIKQRKKDILKLKEEYDRIEEEMPSKGNVDAVFRNDRLSPEEKQEAVLDILAWDELKEEMLFTGDKVRNLSQRKENIKSDLKKNTKLTDLDVVALTNESDLAQQIDMLTTQVESNKEYKLDNTREHQQLVIKLDALKSLQESLTKFNDPKFDRSNATSVQKERDAMEDAFARYMLAVNTELNSMPDASALASDKNLYQRYKRRFASLFDFYRLDEESKELEYYADLLSNPEYSSQWLRANREMLVEFGKNKKAYIEKAIEAWQTREVSDDMLNELLENGIIFELDELDDLYDKGVMPSTLFDVNSKEEISAEKYKQAVKIIEKYYKKLKGKKLIGAKTGVRATRDKSKTDKRRAATIIKQYVGAKNKGVPVPIIDFVNNMMAYGNRYLSKSEIRILEKLQEYHITNQILSGNVILTDEAESPVSFNENGDLVLDVRFGAFDFARANYEINGVKYSSIAELDKAVNSNKITESQYDQGVRALRATPFEYIAISGIVQNVFVKRFQVDEELKNNITTLMDLAKTSHINNINNSNKDDQQKRMEIAQAETSDIFNNPLVFLTEAYANINFQNFLASTVNSTDVNQESLWRNLNNELRDELGANGIKGSLLDSILGITQLSIDEAIIEDTAESGPIQETDETDEVEEDEEPTPEEMEGEETAPVANVPPEEEVEEEQVTEEPAPVPVNLNELADRKKVINLKIKKLQQDVNGINSEINRTSRLKFRRIGQLEKQKLAIQKEVDTLIKELKSIEQKEKSVTETPTGAKPDLKTPVLNEEDDDSNQVVTSRSEFINLPLDLQLKLAAFYLNNNKGKAPLISIEKLQELQARDEKDIPDNVQGFLKKVSEDDAVAFKEAVFRGFNLLALQGDEKALDYLTDEQIQEIQDLMPTTSFINIIGEYNRNANKQPAPAVTETTEEEDEEENDEAKPLMLSAEAIKELNDANQRALDNIQEVFIDRNLRYTTTFINHLGEEVTITENSRTVLEQLINDTYSENGWANNINNIVGVEFEAIIGDTGTEAKVTITIDKVKITPQGNYQIYATRSDANKRYNILVGRSGMIYTFTETDTGIVSKAEDKVNYIVDFTTKASIVPFDPNRKEPKIEYTSPIQSVEDIQSVYPDIDLTTVFTTEQLNEFATELANATSIEEFKKLAEAFDQTLFDITEGFTDGLTFDIPVAEVKNPSSIDTSEITRMNQETETKLKEEGVDDLFIGATLPTGSAENAIPVTVDVINGIAVATYANEKTGLIDTVISGFSEENFVGYYRIYENGKPTNKWSSKFENKETGNAEVDNKKKENFKTMMSSVQERLPSDHKYTEKTSISTDGLRIWGNQIDRNTYQLEYDENGNLITDRVSINGDAIVNELGIDLNQDAFQNTNVKTPNIKVKTQEEFEKVKAALLPYLQKFGLNENNIYWKKPTGPVAQTGSVVQIDLPVLSPVNKSKSTTTSSFTTPIDFSTLGTLKTEDQLKQSSGVPADEFDEVTSNVKYNWNYLDTSKHNYEGTNKGYASRFSTWSINKRDLAYLRNFQISLFGLEHLDFVDAVLKYLSNGSRLAETVSKFNVKNKSVTQVEDYVRTQLNNAANNRAITSELVNALNKKLNAVRSNLTIAWSESKRKVGNYGITTKTQAQIDTMQQQQDKLDTKSTKLSRKEQALLVDTGNDVRALVLKWFIKGGKINSSVIQKLLGNTKSLKGPKSIKAESAARMSILNNTTGVTLDGLAHIIWENRTEAMNFDTEDAKKEVVDVILRFGGISKMIDELINTYGQPEIETEETEEEKRNREFKEAEEQEAYEYNQILNAYWESEGSNVNQIYLDFEATTLGQILNGTYQGTREDLANDVERRAYDEIYKDTTKKPDVEEDVEEEDFVPKTAIDPIVKKVREYDVNTISGMNPAQKVGTMFNLITANSKFEDLVYIYLSLYNTSTAYSDNQKNAVIRSIKYRLASFSNQIFSPSRTIKINEFQSSTDVVPAGVYEITPINTNTDQRVLFGLRNQLTNEIFQVEGITELFPSIADIYEPGSTLNTNPIDLSLNNNDVEIIKASFTDFFSNFNNIMSDVDKDLNEEDLRSQIAEQFKTCK
jgi:hypothetical protein